MSRPGSCMPVFDVHPNHQNRLDRFQGCYDEANARATSQLAAGSIPSPPFSSTSSPSLDIYSGSFDRWSSLLNSDISSDLHPSYRLDFSVSDPSFSCGSQDSASSSPNLFTPPPSMVLPLEDDILLYPTSPDLLSSPFITSEVGREDLVVPAQPHQGHNVAWPGPSDISHSIPPVQHLYPPTSLSGTLVTGGVRSIANQSLQGTVANNPSAIPGNFIAAPITVDTTVLGLYYPDTSQSSDVPLSPLLTTQAENNASVPRAVQHVPLPSSPAQNWTFRAVDPASKVSRSKCVQSGEACSSDHVLTTTAPSTPSHGTNVEPMVECGKCGYLQLTKRMGDFRRHLKKHEADHLSRVVCCGVPPTHPAAASLRPGHLTHWYDGHLFYGGCGRSYSRMDALQRHLKKSGCISGSARDHRSWRKLYFREKTDRPRKSSQSSLSSESQNSSVPSPI